MTSQPEPDVAQQEESAQPGQVEVLDAEIARQSQRRIVVGVVVFFVVVLTFVIISVYFLAQPTTDTAKVRDIFIIFMAVQSLLTGLTLVVLLVQLAKLTNLLQHEIKPILDSINETISNLRGTTAFLSDNIVSPVIKLNEYLAAVTQLLEVVGLVRKKPKS